MTSFPQLSRQALIASMQKAHVDFLSLIERVTPKEAGRVGVTTQWSLKKLLAHMVGWHHEAMKRIPEVVRGDKAKPFDIQAMNRKFVEDFKEMPWGLLLRDLRNLHSGLVEMAREVPEASLEPGSGVYRWLYQVGCGHYREHMEAATKWVAQLKSQRQNKEDVP